MPGLSELSDEVIVNVLSAYLSSASDVLKFSSIAKRFREILFSKDSSNIWERRHMEIGMCIDSYCPFSCPLKIKHPREEPNYTYAISLLKVCPIVNLKMHCFITDLSKILLAIAHKSTIRRLALKLTNKSDSPPLSSLLPNDLSISSINELILDSSNLSHVNLEGRKLLLKIAGSSLLYLSFKYLTPYGIFPSVSKYCKYLKRLRVDRVKEDFLDYTCLDLEELSLVRCTFLPMCINLNFPGLSCFR